MKLYAFARPLPRGRVAAALIASEDGFFKFDLYAHAGWLGVSPTGYRADIATIEATVDVIQASGPAEALELKKANTSYAVSMVNVTPVVFSQSGDMVDIVLPGHEGDRDHFIHFETSNR